MTSIGPLTTLSNSLQSIERPLAPERPGDDGISGPKAKRFREHLQNQAEPLRDTFASSDVDPARARKARDHSSDGRERLHDRISDRPDRPRPDGDDGAIDPAKVREHLQNLKARLKNAVEEGNFSPERARNIYQKHLERAKEALGIGDGNNGNGQIDPARVRKHLQQLKGRLQNAVGNGDLAPEQAREIWQQHVERAKNILTGDNGGDGNGGGNNGGRIERPDFETIADAKRGNTITIEA
jgi:polyhydroxyalkanoate synthesis regulator phasin